MNCFDKSSGSTEAYQEYKRRFPSSKLSKAQYKEIIDTHNTLLVQYILDTGDTYRMPFGFGPLRIKKFKRKLRKLNKEGEEVLTLPTNWVATLSLWAKDPKAKENKTIVRHLNAHTDGYGYHFYWQPKETKFFMAALWSFKPSREASRGLAKRLLDPDSLCKDLYQEQNITK